MNFSSPNVTQFHSVCETRKEHVEFETNKFNLFNYEINFFLPSLGSADSY